MKTISKHLFILAIIVLICVDISIAQFKSAVPSPYRNSGNIIKVEQNQPTGMFQNLFNMKMSHSYEASFMSMGGQMSNINMYTNSMMFSFTPNLSGKLDVSFAHSPFGNSFSGMNGQNSSQLFIRNAQLDYKISENAKISFSYQQLPYGSMGMNGFGNGYNQFGYNPWSVN